MNKYHVYILTNVVHTVLYIGITGHLTRRIFEHKNGMIEGFTKRYRVHKLVYVEEYRNIGEAIAREKQLKHWNRDWKNDLITRSNPQWSEISCE